MIPKIIHQTWKDENLPVPASMPQSWRDQNPDWEYRFWTDAQLADFVREKYVDLWPLYCAAFEPVKRADIARYLLLDYFGGMYADIDTTCHTPLSVLEAEDRVILSEEPNEHWDSITIPRQLPYLLFNGTMASPKGHPFWQHVIQTMKNSRLASEVLETTGPLMLTGAAMTYPAQEQLALHSCHLFNQETKFGYPSTAKEHGPFAPLKISTHHWAGTWFTKQKKDHVEKLRTLVQRGLYRMNRGPNLTTSKARAKVDEARLAAPLSKFDPANLPTISIFITVRDASMHLTRCFELLSDLDYPKDKLKITFCEGWSEDDTSDILESLITAHKDVFRGLQAIQYTSGRKIPRQRLDQPTSQYRRLSAQAATRNHLMSVGLDDSDEWALWLDVDVIDYPRDILQKLLADDSKIVVPDCTRYPNSRSSDRDIYLDIGAPKNSEYYRLASGGYFRHPERYHWHKHLHDLRYLDRAPLSSVGGSMLLVHESVHNSGVTFPEIPYCDLLDTPAFGRLAANLGMTPIGLPHVEVTKRED